MLQDKACLFNEIETRETFISSSIQSPFIRFVLNILNMSDLDKKILLNAIKLPRH